MNYPTNRKPSTTRLVDAIWPEGGVDGPGGPGGSADEGRTRAARAAAGRGRPADPRRASLLSALDREQLLDAARHPLSHDPVLREGLDAAAVESRRATYGPNVVDHERPLHPVVQFVRTFANPFIVILTVLATVMFVTEVLLADPVDGPDWTGVVTIGTMVLVSAALRFWQEYRSGRSVEALSAMVRTTVSVTRRHADGPLTMPLPLEDLVPGDVVQLSAGDVVPADVRLLRTTDLHVNQSMLTGESLAAEKSADALVSDDDSELLSAATLAFMGTSVVSGSATALVVSTGSSTWFGSMSASIVGDRPRTAFDLGIRRVSMLLVRFMVVMVSIVFVVNGATKGWEAAFLFAVAVAVGLTPEMLPLIVTANLAKGARAMAARRVIVKRLDAIQNLGAIDVLCTDKTGTLTEDHIALERHSDTRGRPSETTLGLAAANAHFQTGLRNLLDEAVLDAAGMDELARLQGEYRLVDEVPFDFDRRRMSVVVDDGTTHQLITKGAVEEVLALCVTERTGTGRSGADVPLDDTRLADVRRFVDSENALGMRVIAVASKVVGDGDGDGDDDDDGGFADREYGVADESDLTLVGFLSFLDPPKESAAEAVRSLRAHGTAVVVVTGDNDLVAATVCREVGIDPGRVVLGADTEGLSLDELSALAEDTTVFAKTDPVQKARIVEALKAGGHTVGFLGDGINDAAALRTADVGISVDTASDIAKESADVLLLDKDLRVLESGVVEGRRTFANTMKYVKMTASSNFGNMFSVLVASALLPFLPMLSIVVLVQNLAYDLSMLTLPWDRVDADYLKKPRKWDTGSLTRFMLKVGPISSIFDISTFALMWFVFGANSIGEEALFQSGWFVESIISQTLIVHMLRTQKIPFVQSRASLPVMLATAAVCVFGLLLPFSGWGASLGLVALPLDYFPWLVGTLAVYCGLVQLVKVRFVRRHGVWL